ncbi:geranylgeranylglyceryl/heptaprenylglyceryl phosphate synthase, partial [Cecembia sp.]|uniref:geranylgeranylglyceryl/heptaprenylglyceryl phosphate synthase n=1 Tax=Cecembia sp. TaxID=1898110 RepID=UPI0025B8CC19
MKRKVAERLKSLSKSGRKGLAWLIDPDDVDEGLGKKLKEIEQLHLDFIFVGGSLIHQNNVYELITTIRSIIPKIPIVIFPGNTLQFSANADALLFLSLISGRNPVNLIGEHVKAAPIIKKSKLEPIATGYMLVESGAVSSV